MRNIVGRVLGSAALLLLASVAASCADLPLRPVLPPAAPVPIFTWTGFYVGAYGGGAFGGHLTSNGVSGGVAERPSGFVVGGLAGYNFQFERAVVGVEGEAGYNDSSANVAGPRRTTLRDNADFVSRVRGRLGFTIGNFGFGDAFAFAAGGGSFQTDTETLTDGRAGARPASASKTASGFNIGGGLEVAVTPSVLARAEYIYDDYGKENYFLSGGAVVQNRSVKINDSTVRAALQYKF